MRARWQKKQVAKHGISINYIVLTTDEKRKFMKNFYPQSRVAWIIIFNKNLLRKLCFAVGLY